MYKVSALLCMSLVLLFSSCDSDDVSGLDVGSGSSFEGNSGTSMSIDDIVTDVSFPVTAPVSAGSLFPFHVLIGATPEYYYGRYIKNDGGDITCGLVSFKVVKESNDTAYFADWTVHRIVDISSPSNVIETLNTDTAADVPAGYDASTNHLSILDDTRRHVNFKINFDDNTYLPDISNGAVVFSEDFETMVGGSTSFAWIASRRTSAPAAADNDALVGSWSAYNFFPTSGGDISTGATSGEDYNGIGSGSLSMTAVDGEGFDFNGEADLMDAEVGVFAYAEGALGSTLASIDGVLFIGPKATVMMRFDLNTDEDLFACDVFK